MSIKPKKARRKIEALRFTCREQAKQGMINLPNGQFGRGVDNSMKRDLMGGYRIGRR